MKKFIILIIILFAPVAIFSITNTNKMTNTGSLTNNYYKEVILYKLSCGEIISRYNGYYGTWYRIRWGDSLYRISKRFGVSIKRLARANRIRRRSRIKYKSFLFIPYSKKYLESRCEKITIKLKQREFIWPLYGRITSRFGLRRWGWRKKFHKGIDIAAPVGTKVIASKEGMVSFAGRRKRYGYVVIIKHDKNMETRYAHLQKITVKKGEFVRQGEVIGLVGKTGRATGYHLHFEIRINNTPVNPEDYLPLKPGKLARIYYEERCKSLGLRP